MFPISSPDRDAYELATTMATYDKSFNNVQSQARGFTFKLNAEQSMAGRYSEMALPYNEIIKKDKKIKLKNSLNQRHEDETRGELSPDNRRNYDPAHPSKLFLFANEPHSNGRSTPSWDENQSPKHFSRSPQGSLFGNVRAQKVVAERARQRSIEEGFKEMNRGTKTEEDERPSNRNKSNTKSNLRDIMMERKAREDTNQGTRHNSRRMINGGDIDDSYEVARDRRRTKLIKIAKRNLGHNPMKKLEESRSLTAYKGPYNERDQNEERLSIILDTEPFDEKSSRDPIVDVEAKGSSKKVDSNMNKNLDELMMELDAISPIKISKAV